MDCRNKNSATLRPCDVIDVGAIKGVSQAGRSEEKEEEAKIRNRPPLSPPPLHSLFLLFRKPIRPPLMIPLSSSSRQQSGLTAVPPAPRGIRKD